MSNDYMELAEVVWFNTQKHFGFARDRWGKEIFFHFNDGRFVKVENGSPTFAGPTVGNVHINNPLPGDMILFLRTKGSKGRPKAAPWCYDTEYLEQFRQYEEGLEPCPLCTHLVGEHAGGVRCMEPLCFCGDELLEHEQDEDEPREVWFTEAPGGHHGFE